MAISNLLALNNAVKLDTVSFFCVRPNHNLARLLSQKPTSCFNHEASLKAVTSLEMHEAETIHHSDKIGILRFLKGKTYLITDATRLLAKVLSEKLLRASPEIVKIFLMMRSKDQESANKRLYGRVLIQKSTTKISKNSIVMIHDY